jgi:predicted alpha/beta-fold hydrolase
VLIINPVGPPPGFGEETELEVMDFSDNIYITQAIEMVKKQFGSETEIYACGFSLGSNHLLRHLGTHEGCRDTCGIKAAVSVSGAFDILATGIQLKYETFGIYDWYIKTNLQKPFLKKRFKIQTQENGHYLEACRGSTSIVNFD